MSVFDGKSQSMGYVQAGTGVYRNTSLGRITDGNGGTVAGEKECRDTREKTDRSGRRR